MLVPLVRDVLRRRTRDDWLPGWKAGVPSGAIRTVGEVCDSETLRARDMIAHIQHSNAGTVKAIKNAMQLSTTPLDTYRAPPTLGEHTGEVLTRLAGLDEADLHRLRSDGIV